MKDDRLYLIHITECIERVREYTSAGRSVFMTSHITQDAVVRNLQTMAESTQRLSDAVKDAHPEIDWSGIMGFRNVLTHGYLGLDPERVWNIVEHELSALERFARDALG